MPKSNFCGINDWKVLFGSVVALFLEDLTPSRLLCCQIVHLDKRFYCFAKEEENQTCWIFNYIFLLKDRLKVCFQMHVFMCFEFSYECYRVFYRMNARLQMI